MDQEPLLNGKYKILRKIEKKVNNKIQNISPKNIIAINQNTQQTVFIKRIRWNSNQYDQLYFNNELETYQKIRSRNVINYIEEFFDDEFRYFVLEYFQYNNHSQQSTRALNLQEYLDSRNGTVSEIEAISIIKQILNGFRAIHNQLHLLHQNIALDNILISEKGQIKIIGFSMCSLLDTVELHNSIKEPFRQQLKSTTAPEILAGNSLYMLSSDIYSIGAIFYKLIFGRYPYLIDENEFRQSDPTGEILQTIQDDYLTFDSKVKIGDQTKNIIRQMLRENPKDRISFKDLNQNDLFKIQYQNNNENNLVSFANKLDLMKNSIIYDDEVELNQKYQQKKKDLMAQSVESQKEKSRKIAKMINLSQNQQINEENLKLSMYTRRINHIQYICFTIEEIYKKESKSRSITLLIYLLIKKVIQAAKHLEKKIRDIFQVITIANYKKEIQESLNYLQTDVLEYQLIEFREYVVRIYGENEINQLDNMNEENFNNYFKKTVLDYINKTQNYLSVHIHILQCCIARNYNQRVIEIKEGLLEEEFKLEKQPNIEEINELIRQI